LSSENSNAAVSQSLHSQRLTVWVALYAEGINEPIIFHFNVNFQKYLKMLRITLYQQRMG